MEVGLTAQKRIVFGFLAPELMGGSSENPESSGLYSTCPGCGTTSLVTPTLVSGHGAAAANPRETPRHLRSADWPGLVSVCTERCCTGDGSKAIGTLLPSVP